MKTILLFIIGGFFLLLATVVALALLFVFGAFLIPLLVPLFIFAFGVLSTIFWIWMLIDCIKNQSLSETEKILWVLAIVFTHFIGATIYFFAGRTRPILSRI